MFERILMELYDDYEKNGIQGLIDFTNKTLPKDGTNDLFIGCVLILFSNTSWSKPRYNMTRERLYSIVLSAKEKIGPTNLLAFYIDRVNTVKGINKYLSHIVEDKNLEKYADLILGYLDQFKPDFISKLKNNSKLEEYIETKNKDSN